MADPSAEPHSLDRLVTDAARRITRLEPSQAFTAAQSGGLIIDTRARDSRGRDGVIPGSLHIPRTVLEWRVALDSDYRSPYVGGTDQQIILICDHGYSSILAAANLVELGFHRTADVIGGFEAWVRAGLPTAAAAEYPSVADTLPGMGPPE